MTTIDLPFSIGQIVWVPTFVTDKKLVPCPECGGTKVVRVTNHAGHVATVDCEHCQLDGWQPHGHVYEEVGQYVTKRLNEMETP